MFEDIADYRNSFAYNEHWREFDVRHMISTIMSEPIDGYVSFIGLCKTTDARPFSETDRQIKQFLMPHLSEALRLNRQMALHIPGDEEEGMALVNHKGMILASRPPFDALLREEWGHDKLCLPATIFNGDKTFGDWCGESIRLQYRHLNGHYLVRARPVSSLDKLPPRAQEAAELYAAGFSHKEVAKRMGISPETVRKHLSRTFSQLGITNKASLAQLVSQSHKQSSFWIPPSNRSPDMPYNSTSQLPESVRSNLPKHAQEIYMAAFNNAWEEYSHKQDRRGDNDREEVAHKVAWSAVKQQYEKRDGKWREKT
jgi:cation transport regulator ChaB/DNA-binding CsgD family transcriptional regulator